jgi:hypothetical protein
MSAYLGRFADGDDDGRVRDVRETACALVHAQGALDSLQWAANDANGVEGWRGRMAHGVLYAVGYMVQAAIHLLVRGDDATTGQRLQRGVSELAGALHEGLFHADEPSAYDLSARRLPKRRG